MTSSPRDDRQRRSVCVVTGASSGIGLATAIALSHRAERLGLICRDDARSRAARDTIRAANPKAGPIDLWPADLASFASVRSVATSIRSAYDRIDVLVNNAGAVFSERKVSEDGLEMHFATNYAGHFLLTALLLESLSRAPRARLVTITSSLYRWGRLRLDDLSYSRPYHLVSGYAQSKLAGILFTLELTRRTRAIPIVATCVDPGFVRTGIHRGASGHQRWLARRCERFGREPSSIAALIERLVIDGKDADLAGRYWTAAGPQALSRRARDRKTAEALWRLSLTWLTADEAAPLTGLTTFAPKAVEVVE